MKVLVVYDSVYGNTKKIGKAIGEAIAQPDEVTVRRVTEADPSELAQIDLLIIGAPTQGGRATPAIQDFLEKAPESAIRSIRIATFDTRLSTRFVGIFGYAAGRIARTLKDKGGNLVAAPEGFFVKGREGPLKDGELERAAVWAKEVAGAAKQPGASASREA